MRENNAMGKDHNLQEIAIVCAFKPKQSTRNATKKKMHRKLPIPIFFLFGKVVGKSTILYKPFKKEVFFFEDDTIKASSSAADKPRRPEAV